MGGNRLEVDPARWTRTLRLTCLSVLAFFVQVSCVKDVIPPERQTETTMRVLNRRILLFAREHNCLPLDLRSLPELGGYDTRTVDGWGNPIRLEIAPDGLRVCLHSSGDERRTSRDEIRRCFVAKDEEGRWKTEDAEWE